MAGATVLRTTLILATLVVAPGAAAAGDAQRSLRFTFAPVKAYQEKSASVAIAVRPAGVRCTLAVRYADGSTQPNLRPRVARRGRARWTWDVPRTADAGAARVSAACARVGRISRTMVIIGATALPAKLVVERSGWTQRPNATGGSSHVSFGMLIANPNTAHDVKNVTVLVNFLNAEGRVLGSKTERVDGIGAGATFALGGYMSLLTQVPVTRLEIVVTRAEPVPRALFSPSLVALGIEPSQYDRGWVGAVAGEVVNDHATFTLTRARLSIVIFDAAGGILGGGTTSTLVALPPGTRVLFKASFGFKSIPIDRASTVQVSVSPTWTPPGT